MATETLDELRLQQLLAPFQNQNTGITNTTAASPFINTTDILNQYNVPNSTNQNLVDAIIAENQRKVSQFDPRNFQSIFPTNVQTGITQQAPLQDLGIDTSYGIANEPDVEQVDYLPGQKPRYRDMFLNDLRNLPSDFRTSLGQTRDALFEDFSGLGNFVRDIYGSGKELIGKGIGTLANILTGNPFIGGVMSLMSRMKTPMSSYQMSDLQRRGYGDELSRIYGPGGIMQGYNPVSMFGRGPLESIINRRNKAKSEAIRNKLNEEITKLGGSTDTNLSAYRASRPASERRSTGPAGGGRDNTGGDKGAKGAADSFSNRSGMGRTGY